MGTSTLSRLRDLRRSHGAKALKYASVSVVGIVVTQALLVVCYQVIELSAGWSNFVAVSGASIPAYLLNRQWVWQRSGRHSLRREVLPFWAISLLGLVISTVAVSVVSRWWDSQIAVSGTNIASFGLLWVGKFLFLDAIMFSAADSSVNGPVNPDASAVRS